MSKAGIYIHIPFCSGKCFYCDFYSAPASRDAMDAYTRALCAHIASTSGAPQADTVYIGGGTPSYLGTENLIRILGAVRGAFSLESGAQITLEANPGDICAQAGMPDDAEKALSRLREAGHRHFVYTHRGASCRAILENCGLLPYFTEIVTALDGYPRKPAPDAIFYLMKKYALAPAQCYYVGDRSLDMEAAHNASIGGILLLVPGSPTEPTGYESHVARDLTELCPLFGA